MFFVPDQSPPKPSLGGHPRGSTPVPRLLDRRGILAGLEILTCRNCLMLKRILAALLLLLCNVLWAQTANPATQPGPSQPLIILIGPPLSGKTTLVDLITRTYDVPNISVEDLIKDHAAELEHLRAQGMSMAEMRYDPAMSRYLRERLKTVDLSHGIALDGYPATLVQAEDLSKMVPDLHLTPIAI